MVFQKILLRPTLTVQQVLVVYCKMYPSTYAESAIVFFVVSIIKCPTADVWPIALRFFVEVTVLYV